ncbi:hypothetical protein DL93DRAFT_2100786 [Clavulina sp. PMI_390]|nr:hypothetical protein DL93DRAFT_2100786 [Clavulina sp. PMI_390]
MSQDDSTEMQVGCSATVSASKSPVGYLPPEIVLDILELVVEDENHRSGKRAHLLLSVIAAICSDWRRVVLDCPSFWTTISFFGSDNTVKSTAEFRYNMLFLERSGMAPLSIYLFDPAEKPTDDWQGPTMWEIISPQFYRCKALSITFMLINHLSRFLTPHDLWERLDGEEFPELEQFTHKQNLGFMSLPSYQPNAAGTIPRKWANVKIASFIRGGALVQLHQSRLPGIRALHLEVDHSENRNAIYQLTTWAPALTSLHIKLGSISLGRITTCPPFPNLKHLHTDSLVLATLLSSASDALDSLTLTLMKREPAEPSQLITKSSIFPRVHQLRTLRYVGCNFTVADNLLPWEALSSLEELEFSGCVGMPSMLEGLKQSFLADHARNGDIEKPQTCSSGGGELFPRLKRWKFVVPVRGMRWVVEIIEARVRQLGAWRPLVGLQLRFDTNA